MPLAKGPNVVPPDDALAPEDLSPLRDAVFVVTVANGQVPDARHQEPAAVATEIEHERVIQERVE
jgi:hypothetical protein